jgi:hypothetical protein
MLNACRKQASKYEIACGSTQKVGHGIDGLHEIACGDTKDLKYVIDDRHLHKIVELLSDSASCGFSDATVDKLAGMAEGL